MIQSIEDGRREAGQRSIADKIIKRLHDLEKTVENNQGRWAWELLQNAKDSIAEDDDRTVSIQIELDRNSVTFRHNGNHFTSQDVIGLIDQISSKEVEEGQETKKTGRFGTGFLTTHLLSRVIKIKGIIGSADGSFHKFEFLLNRQGRTTAQLMPRITNSWKEFDESIEKISPSYDKNCFNTSFCYQLDTEEQKKIAQIGVDEFSRLIPFVLAFIPKIGRVEIIDNIAGEKTSYEKNRELKDDLIVYVSKIKNDKQEDISILYLSNERVAIATEVEKCERGYSVKGVRDLPKLFCDFPLIGTENFHFPVVVNSFFFNPQTERDGIWLKGIDDTEVIENQKILESAVGLYRDLISKIAQDKFFNLYNIAETQTPSTDHRYFDKEWYQKSIQKPIREFIYNALIVELEDESAKKRAIKDLYFPKTSFSEAVRNKIWQFVFDLVPNAVCKRFHLHNWCGIAWGDWETVDYKRLVEEVAKKENIYNLSQVLKRNESNTFEWLNSLGTFLLEDDNNLILIQRNPIIPNRNGCFKREIDLYIDAIQDDELIYVLELLGEDWKDILLHNSMNYIRDHIQEKEKRDIAVRITENLNRELKNSSYNENENLVKAISLLSEWFENNSEEGRELFSEIYSKRAEIFMNTIQDKESLYKVMRTCTDLSKLAEVAKAIEDDSEIIEKIQGMEQITSLLEEFKADDISDLKTMLILARNVFADDSKKIEITQEILLSLGVTSIDELEKALQDKGIAAQFMHTSTPTVEMFIAVQRLIERTKNNVIKHLQSIEDYDCTDVEELATTVIGGIKKDGLPIYIVVRPSDNGEVIIYYSSEKDTLDDPNSELWIDNGIEKPRRLTLGKVLKTTGINRIPVN
ncbi:sacsin N-terminal ATP-binding-like domain-containing protein [Lyngbya sp. PCC 8106]|uniref:sacsin N-terminal ATP-binding-like domain-containing protein n=1 Tax=Lyngbya sp. (strain PCC 8106) TaxID=313612 RepID=UPI0018DD4126|nr:ATP-binding protein [Lyngbya sp. PCC 8106]